MSDTAALTFSLAVQPIGALRFKHAPRVPPGALVSASGSVACRTGPTALNHG